MKVLVSDVLGEIGIKMFQDEPGIEVDVNTGLEPEALKGIIGDYDGLVIRSATKVTEEILEAEASGAGLALLGPVVVESISSGRFIVDPDPFERLLIFPGYGPADLMSV